MKLTDEGQPGPNRPQGGGVQISHTAGKRKQRKQGFTDGDRRGDVHQRADGFD